MQTIGIDLASQAAGTAAALIEWGESAAVVGDSSFWTDLADSAIVELVESHGAARVGIDAPFGWPTRFIEAVSEWEAAGRWGGGRELQPLRYRLTDTHVHNETGRVPLSVSTDLISICAFRCASLLTAMAGEEPVVRVGGQIVEVYPAAALNRWALPFRGYKGQKAIARDLRVELIASLESTIPLSVAPAAKNAYLENDHCFDALICALIARAVSQGLTDELPEATAETILEEGWIELPTAESLGKLIGG